MNRSIDRNHLVETLGEERINEIREEVIGGKDLKQVSKSDLMRIGRVTTKEAVKALASKGMMPSKISDYLGISESSVRLCLK